MFWLRTALLFLLQLHALLALQNDQNVTEFLSKMANEYEKLVKRNRRFLLYPVPVSGNYYEVGRPVTTTTAPTYNPNVEEYDFIIVGSGSSGAALASRLSENPKWRILLLEVGKEPSFVTDIPAIAGAMQFTDYNWGYLMEKQDNMCLGLEDQRMHWPRGRGLGGTTLINYMIHVRGNRRDYDKWAALGNPGWKYRDVLPYFKRLEDSSVSHAEFKYRNRGGPVSVEDVAYRTDSCHAFVKSSMEAGHKYVDYNGGRQMGVSYVQSTTRSGRRCSAEVAYLRNARRRPNLKISLLSRATKLLIDDDKNVVGVEYVKDKQYHTAKANKEVILSAGTFNSPQLLMLSGIGPAQHLAEIGVKLVQDLPVGEVMYDHLCFMGLVFTLNETKMTLDFNEIQHPRSVVQLVQNGTGPLTSLGGVEALLYLQTQFSEESKPYPDMELIFIGGGLHTDYNLISRKIFKVKEEVYNAIWRPLEGKQAWSVLPMLLHPRSKGNLRLKSKNPYNWPKLYGNFLTDPQGLDIKTFIAAIREVQRISRSPTFQRFNSQQVRTPVPGCQHLTFDSDEYWECALRHISSTLHHQVSTCKMGPSNDPEAVVDHKLKVYGIKGLRVADCSVIPVTLSAHTNVPAMMIGERAADLIKEEWAVEGQFVKPRAMRL